MKHTLGYPTLFSMPPLATGHLPNRASLVVLGAQYDGASFGPRGSNSGPTALRHSSSQVWTCRSSLPDGCVKPPFSPSHGALVLEDECMYDAGDLIPEDESPEEVAQEVCRLVGPWLDLDCKTVLLGGDHSISFGMAQALSMRHPAGILYFDAHLDASPVPQVPLTHGSWAGLSRGLPGLQFVAQVGLRTFQPVPADFELAPGQDPQTAFSAWGVDRHLPASHLCPQSLAALVRTLPQGLAWHLSVDVDVLDPSVMPATGMPLPLGLQPGQLLQSLRFLVQELDVRSLDLTEFSPPIHGANLEALTLAGILAELLPDLLRSGT